MVQCDDPFVAALAHQPGIDAVLRVLRTVQLIAADELGRIRPEHFDLDVEKVQRAARFHRAAVVADVVIERALPVTVSTLRTATTVGFPSRFCVDSVVSGSMRRRETLSPPDEPVMS